MDALVPLNREALAAWYELADSVGTTVRPAPADPFLAAYRTSADRSVLLEELNHIRSAGQDVKTELLDGDEARAIEPLLGSAVGAGLLLHDQAFVDPASFVTELGEQLARRGVVIKAGTTITDITSTVDGVLVGDERHDAVVVATGAHLGVLARRFGVRMRVQAGRGYSFVVPLPTPPSGPVYFPAERVACTPLAGGLRVAGMMEFRPADAPPDPRRINAIAHAAGTMLRDLDTTQRRDEWVGARPCTPDGLPLLGVTADPRVHVAGGHGMWGMTLGPLTGRLVADGVLGHRRDERLARFDPLR